MQKIASARCARLASIDDRPHGGKRQASWCICSVVKCELHVNSDRHNLISSGMSHVTDQSHTASIEFLAGPTLRQKLGSIFAPGSRLYHPSFSSAAFASGSHGLMPCCARASSSACWLATSACSAPCSCSLEASFRSAAPSCCCAASRSCRARPRSLSVPISAPISVFCELRC